VEVRAVVRAWPRLLEVLTLSVRRAVVVQTCGRMSADVMCRAGNRRAPVVVQAVMGVGRVAGAVLVVAVVGCGSPNSLNQAAGGRSSAPGDASSPTVTTNAPSIPAPPPVCASTLLFPEITSDLIVEDGTFASVASMARAAELIVVGEVVEVVSLGRPDVEEDPNADEYVAVTTDVTEILKGDPISEVVLGWDAFGYDTDGNRVSTLLSNGVRPPQVGDRLLLFLVVADPAFADALGGVPSHQEVKLDGVAYLDGDRLIAGELGSRVADELLAMSLNEIRDLINATVRTPTASSTPGPSSSIVIDTSTPPAPATAVPVPPRSTPSDSSVPPHVVTPTTGDAPTIRSGSSLSAGVPVSYELGTHCGVRILGKFNGQWWRARDAVSVRTDWSPTSGRPTRTPTANRSSSTWSSTQATTPSWRPTSAGTSSTCPALTSRTGNTAPNATLRLCQIVMERSRELRKLRREVAVAKEG